MYSRDNIHEDITIGLDHIENHQKGDFGLAIDILSMTKDFYLFSDYIKNTKDDLHVIKVKWFKYVREIFEIFGDNFEVKYNHPYKSDKLKHITGYRVYVNGMYREGGETWGRAQAELEAYIPFTKFIIDSEKGTEWANKVMEPYLKKYNEIHNDTARFICSNRSINVESKGILFGITRLLMDRLNKPEILREVRINFIVDEEI